jgi:hypothetical protein
MNTESQEVSTGTAAAAFTAAGVGCFSLGVFTTLAEVSPAVKSFLNWWDPAGPLSGKAGWAVIVWLIAWAALHLAWGDRTIAFGRMFGLSLVLIALGLIGTFPTFFQIFEH